MNREQFETWLQEYANKKEYSCNPIKVDDLWEAYKRGWKNSDEKEKDDVHP